MKKSNVIIPRGLVTLRSVMLAAGVPATRIGQTAYQLKFMAAANLKVAALIPHSNHSIRCVKAKEAKRALKVLRIAAQQEARAAKKSAQVAPSEVAPGAPGLAEVTTPVVAAPQAAVSPSVEGIAPSVAPVVPPTEVPGPAEHEPRGLNRAAREEADKAARTADALLLAEVKSVAVQVAEQSLAIAAVNGDLIKLGHQNNNLADHVVKVSKRVEYLIDKICAMEDRLNLGVSKMEALHNLWAPASAAA